MGIEPRFIKRGAQAYAGSRQRVRRDALPDIAPRALSEVREFLQRHHIAVTGPPLIRYLVVDYSSDDVEVDIGAPVDTTALPDDQRVRCGLVPAGTYATVRHCGSYVGLVQTTAQLLDWAKQHGVRWQVVDLHNVTEWGGRVEQYLIGPAEESDPAKWVTEIAILIARDDA